mmetsp:Transcript_16974/g.48486  ORF Transcript_16974/g.48486 Transcript_16974/m.48486 type:complete len:106 (+) Transcript_16974:38-355(+)
MMPDAVYVHLKQTKFVWQHAGAQSRCTATGPRHQRLSFQTEVQSADSTCTTSHEPSESPTGKARMLAVATEALATASGTTVDTSPAQMPIKMAYASKRCNACQGS